MLPHLSLLQLTSDFFFWAAAHDASRSFENDYYGHYDSCVLLYLFLLQLTLQFFFLAAAHDVSGSLKNDSYGHYNFGVLLYLYLLLQLALNFSCFWQLRTTSADLLKMIPMAIMILVPFMEFVLPLVLYIFPGILPSTFKHEWKKCVLNMFHCVAVCCSVLKCVVVCCSVLPCGPVLQSIFPAVCGECCSVLQCFAAAVCCSVLQCVAVCCSVLQCVAVCC